MRLIEDLFDDIESPEEIVKYQEGDKIFNDTKIIKITNNECEVGGRGRDYEKLRKKYPSIRDIIEYDIIIDLDNSDLQKIQNFNNIKTIKFTGRWVNRARVYVLGKNPYNFKNITFTAPPDSIIFFDVPKIINLNMDFGKFSTLRELTFEKCTFKSGALFYDIASSEFKNCKCPSMRCVLVNELLYKKLVQKMNQVIGSTLGPNELANRFDQLIGINETDPFEYIYYKYFKIRNYPKGCNLLAIANQYHWASLLYNATTPTLSTRSPGKNTEVINFPNKYKLYFSNL